jgi:gamma-glutamyltranspeptidase / glutathione hydrolase
LNVRSCEPRHPTTGDRQTQIEKARTTFAQGFFAETIDNWMRSACVMDAEGGRRKGVLTGQEMATWQATYERPLSVAVSTGRYNTPSFPKE